MHNNVSHEVSADVPRVAYPAEGMRGAVLGSTEERFHQGKIMIGSEGDLTLIVVITRAPTVGTEDSTDVSNPTCFCTSGWQVQLSSPQ